MTLDLILQNYTDELRKMYLLYGYILIKPILSQLMEYASSNKKKPGVLPNNFIIKNVEVNTIKLANILNNIGFRTIIIPISSDFIKGNCFEVTISETF